MATNNSNGPTSWTGWVYFAGAMMLVMGGLQIFAGLAALLKPTYYVVTANHLIALSFTAWGWIDLIIGIFVLLAGLAVINGSTWGRVVAVFLTVVSALANLAFLSSYPLWSIIALVIDGLVLYALCVHGNEVRRDA